MPTPASLALFGVLHPDDPAKVTAELEAFVGDDDGLCIEYPTRRLGIGEIAQVLVRTPLFVIGAAILGTVVQRPLYVWLNRDIFPTEVVAVRRLVDEERPVHGVDTEHPMLACLDAGPAVVLGHWLPFLVIAWFTPIQTAVTMAVALGTLWMPPLVRRRGHRYLAVGLVVASLVAVGVLIASGLLSVWLVLVGALITLVTLGRTVGDRNGAMLERVRTVADREGYENVVLITGRNHLGGLAERLAAMDIDLDRVHVSLWRRDGRTCSAVDPEWLPTVRRSMNPAVDGYELRPEQSASTVGRRIGAALIDAILVGVAVGVLWIVIAFGFVAVGVESSPPVALGILGLSLLLVVCYHALFEGLTAATPGKWLLGLRVVDNHGDRIGLRAAVGRNLLRPVALLAGYLLTGVAVVSSDRSQHVSDRLAGTVVVRRKRVGDSAAGTGAPSDDKSTVSTAGAPEPTPERADVTPSSATTPVGQEPTAVAADTETQQNATHDDESADRSDNAENWWPYERS